MFSIQTLNKCVLLVLMISAVSTDSNLSLKLLETRPSSANRFGTRDLQTEGGVSSKLNDMLQSLESAVCEN